MAITHCSQLHTGCPSSPSHTAPASLSFPPVPPDQPNHSSYNHNNHPTKQVHPNNTSPSHPEHSVSQPARSTPFDPQERRSDNPAVDWVPFPLLGHHCHHDALATAVGLSGVFLPLTAAPWWSCCAAPLPSHDSDIASPWSTLEPPSPFSSKPCKNHSASRAAMHPAHATPAAATAARHTELSGCYCSVGVGTGGVCQPTTAGSPQHLSTETEAITSATHLSQLL